MANVPRSFLQVAAKEEEAAPPLRVVQIEGLVILKIIKHCKEFSPALVTGQLLGLDVGSVLEVTNCFPFPVREEDEEIEAEGANYQLEMMRCLREVNVDNNTVGWYQSTLFGSFQTVELIETFMNYQENIKRCVCIIYDPSRSNQGVLALKALKLSDSFMELYKSNNFTGEKLREKNLSWVDIFEEIPIKVSNSALISAFMTELEPDTPVTQCDYERLQLSTNPYLERNVEFLIECMDDLSMEQQKIVMLSLTLIFAIVHSGLASLRDKGEELIGEHAFRVLFAGVSLPLAVSTIVYFINHRHDGVQLWQLNSIAGIHELIWFSNFISFFFLYPSTFNLLEVAAVDKPKMHLWETGIMRITRHPQLVGQVIWCLAHTLWIGNSVAVAASVGLIGHHLFGAWNGDRRLAIRYGEAFEVVKNRTSIIPFAAILDGRQKLPEDYYKEFIRLPYLSITALTLGAYFLHPVMQAASYRLHW